MAKSSKKELSRAYSMWPEEMVNHYNAAVEQREKAIQLDRDSSIRADARKFLINVIGRGYAKYHNEAMDAVPKAQRMAEYYAREHMLTLKMMAKGEAEAAGKEIHLPED